MSQFRGAVGDLEKELLEEAASDAGLRFIVPGERPQDSSANHWHGKLQ